MKLLGFEISKVRKSSEKDEELDMARERKQMRLDHEKALLDEKLVTERKRQELDRARLEYEIKAQQCKMDEEFSDTDPDLDDVIDDAVGDDIPEFFKPYIPQLIAKFTGQAQPSGTIPTSNINNSGQITPEELSYTDEELKIIKQSTKKEDLAALKMLPDAQCKSIIKQRYPKLTDECLERDIHILK